MRASARGPWFDGTKDDFMMFQKRLGQLWNHQMTLGLLAGPVPMPLKRTI
jgi:hypothetical protein